MAAWVKRLDDKELVLFSCPNLFPYFDLPSRMAAWKEQPGGTGFGSADQPEHRAWTDRRRLMDSDALSSKVMGSEVLGCLGSNVLGSEALARKALATEALAIDHVGHSDPGSGEGTHGAIQRHVVRLPYLG